MQKKFPPLSRPSSFSSPLLHQPIAFVDQGMQEGLRDSAIQKDADPMFAVHVPSREHELEIGVRDPFGRRFQVDDVHIALFAGIQLFGGNGHQESVPLAAWLPQDLRVAALKRVVGFGSVDLFAIAQNFGAVRTNAKANGAKGGKASGETKRERKRIREIIAELMDELQRTLEALEIDYYKPAVKCLRKRILSGKFR